MESTSLVGDVQSPESTVTSLLSSSGHLRSSLRVPEGNPTFRYRDQEYDSASEALDAYIADFERSSGSRGMLMGPLVLPQDRHSTISRARLGKLRNKDVLRERLTDRELDFLNLPVSSLHHHGNHDRLSMTTDELLSIPYDGSMPVTHTSAFIQDLLSQSGLSSTRPTHGGPAGLCGGCDAPHRHCVPARSCCCRRRAKLITFRQAGDTAAAASSALPVRQSAHGAERPPSSLDQAEPDSSEMGSVLDPKWPAWIQHCSVGEASPDSWDDPGPLHPTAPTVGPPSWVSDLEKHDEPDDTPAQADQQQSLRDLRLRLAGQMSLLAAETGSSDVLTPLLRGSRMESLIQKADQVLNWLSQGAGGSDSPANPVGGAPQSPANTEDLPQRSANHAAPFSPGASASGLTTHLSRPQVEVGGLSPDGRWKQPGPLEALKQMLFRLQAVEAELHKHRQEHAALQPDVPHTPDKQPADSEAEFPSFSGSPSLQRALHHLSRLKLLVEEPKQPTEEGDEGHYLSSAADGLIFSLQETD